MLYEVITGFAGTVNRYNNAADGIVCFEILSQCESGAGRNRYNAVGVRSNPQFFETADAMCADDHKAAFVQLGIGGNFVIHFAGSDFILNVFRITSYNVCYTKLLRQRKVIFLLVTTPLTSS